MTPQIRVAWDMGCPDPGNAWIPEMLGSWNNPFILIVIYLVLTRVLSQNAIRKSFADHTMHCSAIKLAGRKLTLILCFARGVAKRVGKVYFFFKYECHVSIYRITTHLTIGKTDCMVAKLHNTQE